MAHKALMGGTVYEKYGGADLVGGTVYKKDYGKSVVGGTAYEVGFVPSFADFTWEEIITACQNRTIPDTWEVGDQKAMTINGTEYLIDIIGKNHDAYADGSGIAPLTFQFHHVTNDAYRMNDYYDSSLNGSNAGGYDSSDMHTKHLPGILALMPTAVQNAIKQVNKKASAGGTSSTIETIPCKLFLLAEIEVFGKVTRSVSGEGSQYSYYANGGGKTKSTTSGAKKTQWLRSPDANTTTNFCMVNTMNGSGEADSYYNKCNVAPAFCF